MNLKGKDAVNKTTQLMEAINVTTCPTSFSNIEKTYVGNDGRHYAIIRENNGYVLRQSDNFSNNVEDYKYINGLQNKIKYTRKSINEVAKLFNLMNIENKRVYGDTLLNEALDEKKKIIRLKKKSKGESTPQEVEPAPEDEISFGGDDSDELDFGDDGGEAQDDEQPSENPDDYKDVDPDALENEPSEKSIQKLSGKLSYELREFEDEDKYSDTAKFAMSMVTSALQTDKISDEDKASIEKKLSKKMDSDSSEKETEDGDLGDNNGEENLDLEENVISESAIQKWANKISNDYYLGVITPKKLYEILKGTLESFDVYFNPEELKESLKSLIKLGVTDYDLIALVDKHLGERNISEEGEHYMESVNPYGVEKDKILFDLEETDHVFTEPVKPPKNKKYATKIGDIEVGRLEGDDDAAIEKQFFEFGKYFKPNKK